MIIESAFTNFIAIDHLNLDNQVIEKYCYDNLDRNPSSDGNNQSFIIDSNVDNTTDEIRPLLDEVSDRLNHIHTRFNFNKNMRQVITDAWINLNNCKNTAQPHSHRNRFFSAVYYVKGSADTGNITFTSPIAAHGYVIDHKTMIDRFNEFNMSSRWVEPKPGRLIIFPSWLTHYVSPNFTDQDRLSIAFNSKII
jgi:uncharacterized protein (TIGR02466 family)